jgi:predicted permease
MRASFDTFVQDLRYAFRTLRRAPGFAAIATGSAAVGIGACSAIFAIVNAAILRPLPVDDPHALLSVSELDRQTGAGGEALSYLDFRDVQAAHAFSGAAASSMLAASITIDRDPQRHWGAITTAGYFDVIRPGFIAGRGFDAARDDEAGAARVIVLSHGLWQSRFASDPAIVGRLVAVNRRPATVIGVTREGFRGIDLGLAADFWIPMSMADESSPIADRILANRDRFWLSAVARLRLGTAIEQAQAELTVIAERLNAGAERPRPARGFDLQRAGQIQPGFRKMSTVLFALTVGAAILVLLTACANITSLQFGRAAARRREIAARMAVGAPRSRLVRQLLTESLVLAGIGGAGGWMLAAWITSLVSSLRIPLGLPIAFEIPLDSRITIFCTVLSVVTGITFGLLPALRTTRPDAVTALAGDRGTAGERLTLRHTLVVGQVTICTVLLLGMGLFLRSLQASQELDLGFRNENLLLMTFDPGLDRRTDADARRLLRNVVDRADGVTGVSSATLTTSVPLTLFMSNSRFRALDRVSDPTSERIGADIYGVAPGYFETLGISRLAGGDFGGQPTGDQSAIVNDAFARSVFPGESPLGRWFVGDGRKLRVIGLVSTTKSRTIGETPRPSIYLPILDTYSQELAPRGVTLVVRTSGDATAYAGTIREALRDVDPLLAVYDVRTMASHLRDAYLVPRLTGMLSTAAAGIGVMLALIGMYGVAWSAVSRRRREFGVRLAVGATPREIMTMILRRGLVLASIGTAAGCLAGWAVTRFAGGLLYGVSPTDAVTFVTVPAALALVTLLACAAPARSAARVNPADALRSES